MNENTMKVHASCTWRKKSILLLVYKTLIISPKVQSRWIFLNVFNLYQVWKSKFVKLQWQFINRATHDNYVNNTWTAERKKNILSRTKN